MTIKRRFLISYLSAICITLSSVLLILSLAFYITLGRVPNIAQVYKMMTNQRPLTGNEETSYQALDQYLKKSPERLQQPFSTELETTIKEIENQGLSVIIRKNKTFPYYSTELVEKSLIAHAPAYEMNNFMPTGTLDNAGRLYHYVKADFHYLDGSSGSFIILQRESNLFEFFARWGIWVVLFIITIAIFAAWLINYRLKKTTIEPLEQLELAAHSFTTKEQVLPQLQKPGAEKVTKEVQQLQRSFSQMWAELIAAEEQRKRYEENRNQLLSNLSHDLKTPITSIIGYVEGLLDGVANTPEKQQHYLATIHKKGLSLDDLIEQLFLYAKLDIDDVVFTKESTDFSLYLQQLLAEYNEPDQRLITTDFPVKKLNVQLDPLQMRRALVNLIENSLKFQDLNKDQLVLAFRLTYDADYLTLVITDNGIGIAGEELNQVFNRFYREDKSRTPRVKGNGLGLSIVKQIIEHHRGTITLASEKMIGTAVTIRLPLEKEG